MFRKLLQPKILIPLLALSHPIYSMFSHRTINKPGQISKEDLSKNILICYQKTGNQKTDQLVYQLLQAFYNQYRTLISQQFQIVLIEPQNNNLSTQDIQDPDLIIFRSQDYGVLPLGKHIRSGNYKKLFTRMNKQINDGVQQLGLQNLNSVIEANKKSNSQMLFILPQSFDINSIKKAKKYLKGFIDSNQYYGRQIKAYLIKDQPTKNILKLNKQEVKPNQIYILAPKNQNLLEKNTYKFSKVLGKQYTLINPNLKSDSQQVPKSILQRFVFPPFLKKSHPNTLILKVIVDANRDYEKILQKIYQQFSHITDIGKILSFKSLQAENNTGYAITVERNNFDQLLSIFQPNCKYSKDQKIDLLLQSHTWNYEGQLKAQKIKQWIDRIGQGRQQQYYKQQQNQPNQQFSSHKAVGEQYFSLINKGQQQMFFHYSKSCFSCKKFKNIYEQVAKQAQTWQKPVPFYRINNDQNKVKEIKNFNSTPIFVLYRTWNGMKIPFVYKNSYFTKKMFLDYLQISRSIKLVPLQKLNEAIERFESSKDLIKQCL